MILLIFEYSILFPLCNAGHDLFISKTQIVSLKTPFKKTLIQWELEESEGFE